MKIFFYVLLILLSYINTFGQSPDWTVDESKYLHSMTFVMSANYNGTPLSNSNDKVAAFVGGEIRGSSKLYYVSRADRYLAYVTVRANTINETVTFKFYDSVNDQVVNASRTVLFEIDRHYGDSFQTFCISNPDLSSEANITAFSFSGSETTTTTIAEAKVSIASNVYISDNIDQLNAIFELSTGASLYDNGIPKKKISSGSNSIDFSTSQIVNVLSADETTLKAWTIEIIPTWYIGVDADADGFFGSTTSITQSASPGFGYSTTPPATPDCNDSDAAINPNTVWYIGLDTDGDTFFGSTTSVTQCTSPGDGYLTTLQTTDDCNDSDAAINPNTMWYLGLDADADGFFESITSVKQCTSPGDGYATTIAITITADAKSKVYGEVDPALTYQITSGSFIPGETLTGVLTRAAGENVGSYAIASSLSNANYEITFVPANVTITKAAITITADAKEKVYGEVDPALTYQITNGSLINGDTLTGVLARAAGEDVGSYAIASSLSNANYEITFVPANVTITKAAITITADAKSKVYGEVDPALTYQITLGSIEAGDILSGVLSRAAGEDVGSYAIASSLSNANYEITFVPADVTITKAAITITADAKSKVYGEVDPALTYQITSGSFIPGETLTGVLTRAAGEDVGDYAITSTLSNANYEITFVPADVTITKAAITITADAKSKVYGEVDSALTYQITTGSIEAGDTLSGVLSRAAGEDVGSYAIASSLSNANYEITFVPANVTITKAAITITADAKSKVYGEVDPALTYQITTGSLEAGDTFSGVLSRAVGEDVGSYAIASSLSNANYEITFVPADVTITTRPITITANAGQSKLYGNSDPIYSCAVEASGASRGIVAGDSFTGAVGRASGENVSSSYALNQGTLANSNYAISFVSDNFAITPRAITITANAGQSKLYGNSDPSYSYAVEASGVSRGIVAGDSFTGAVGRAPGENVSSSYALNQGTLANSNYAISFVSDNFAITPRAITITADAKSKFYGEVDPVLTYQITSGALMAGDILSGFLMRAEGEDEGSYAITSSLSNINYEITFVPANVTITKVAQTIDDWNGITNTDWNNAANWSLGSVPLSIHTISIPSGLSNYPIIPTNTDAAVHTITIASGASLTLLKGSTLSVIGNFTETSGTVTLNSDSDEFSSLLVGGSTSGNITYNRYVNIVGNGEWDLIGSPVSGMSFSTFLQNANIARNGSFYAVGYYDNTANTWTNVTSAISGYSQLGYGYQMATTSGGTLAFTGAIANGNQSVKIQNNDAANSGAGTRWNIIANPFASYLYANSNADATSNFLTINTAAIDDNFEAIYGHKADGTGYTIYNNTSSATYIAPGQGFFVAAAGNGEDKTISFTKAMQTITGTDDFIASKTSATSYELVLEMHQDAKKLGDTKFYFKEGLTLGLDPGYDAGAFNQGSALSSRLVDNDQGVGMGINAMSIDHMGSVAVPLVVNQEAGIPFALRIANHTLPSDINVYVEDLVEKTLTLVTAQSFELTPQTKLSGIGRFYLHFTRSSLSLESIANTSLITAYKGIGNDYISIEGLQQFSKASKIILYNLLGMKIIDKTIDTPSQKETITIVGIKEGAYILQINYGNQVLTKKMVID